MSCTWYWRTVFYPRLFSSLQTVRSTFLISRHHFFGRFSALDFARTGKVAIKYQTREAFSERSLVESLPGKYNPRFYLMHPYYRWQEKTSAEKRPRALVANSTAFTTVYYSILYECRTLYTAPARLLGEAAVAGRGGSAI